jgi:hypothetical protein
MKGYIRKFEDGYIIRRTADLVTAFSISSGNTDGMFPS